MDWSKSKTIFIVVFLILNIFLYTQYVDVYNQSKQEELMGEKTTEAKLKDENITYITLPTNVDDIAYISGKIHTFKEEDLPKNAMVEPIIVDDYTIEATFKTPFKLKAVEDETSFTEFLQTNVYEGTNYVLWEINEQEQSALFFQKINGQTLYYNANGFLKVYWNDKLEVVAYEQTMLDKIEDEDLQKRQNAFLPIQVLQALYSKDLLPPDSRVTSMNLGYSTLVQLTQTQVFTPTWEVRVRTSDGEIKEHFVNAVEGTIIDLEVNASEFDELD
jgi:regulatory protein YycI of two-component signal transduction system YycFG